MEGENDDTLITELLKELEEKQLKEEGKISTGDDNRDENGFYLHFQGQKGEFYQSTMKFLKSDKIELVKDHYYHTLCNGGELKNLIIIYGKVLKDNETLESYNIVGAVTLTISFKVNGGSLQEKKELIPNFRDEKRIKPSLKPDCIMGYDSKKHLRVEMPCGDVFAPITMYKYIKMIAENITKDLSCPQCKAKCPFPIMAAAAGLNEEELSKYSNLFNTRFQKKKGLLKKCPNCKSYTIRPENLTMFRVQCPACKNCNFCWNCTETWKSNGIIICGNTNCSTIEINKQLETCGYVMLNNVKVPIIRACPSCLTLVTYLDKCKHFICWGCKQDFCFVCLGLKANGKWLCDTYGCNVAPIQILQ